MNLKEELYLISKNIIKNIICYCIGFLISKINEDKNGSN